MIFSCFQGLANSATKFMMIWYHLIFSDNKKAVGYAWNLMGFVVKLAQGVRSCFHYGYSYNLIVSLCADSLDYVKEKNSFFRQNADFF